MLNKKITNNQHHDDVESTSDYSDQQDDDINSSNNNNTIESDEEEVVQEAKKQFSCLSDNLRIQKPKIQVIEDPNDCNEFPVIESWKSFGLDRRIISSVFRQGFHEPTRVQQIAIPIALSGKDIVCSSSTGTGKTAAFLIPSIQMVLHERKINQITQETNRVKKIAENLNVTRVADTNSTTTTVPLSSSVQVEKRGVRVLYLVPSQELCIQVHQQWKLLAHFCRDECNCIYFRSELNQLQQDIKDLCDIQHSILITTPESLTYALNNSSISLKESLKLVIIDEADQIIRSQLELIKSLVSKNLPGIFQCILTSATLKAKQAVTLQEQLLKDPVVIQLDRRTQQALEGKLYQYYVDMNIMQAKLTNIKVNSIMLLYYFINHKFYGGRVIVYVPANKLFFVYFGLKAFGINCVMLPYFYPTLSKIDIIKKFNTNEYQVLISTMEPESTNNEEEEEKNTEELYVANRFTEMIEQLERRAKGIDKTKYSTTVSHLSRGIDYKRVAAVMYFDLPKSCTEYIHGVGRTARAGNVGISVTFVQPYADKNEWENLKKEIESKYGIEDGISPYPHIDMDQVFENQYRTSLLVEHFSKPFTAKYKDAVEMEISNQVRLAMAKPVSHDMEPPSNVEFEEVNPGMVRQDPILLKAGLLANITAKGDTIRSKTDVYSKGKSLQPKSVDMKSLVSKKLQSELKSKDPLFHFQQVFVEQTIERMENAAPVENFMNKLNNNTLGTDNIIKHQRDYLINPKKTFEIKRSIATSHKQKVESLKRGLSSVDVLNPHRKKFKDGFQQKALDRNGDGNNYNNNYNNYNNNYNNNNRGNYNNYNKNNSNYNNEQQQEESYDSNNNYENNNNSFRNYQNNRGGSGGYNNRNNNSSKYENSYNNNNNEDYSNNNYNENSYQNDEQGGEDSSSYNNHGYGNNNRGGNYRNNNRNYNNNYNNYNNDESYNNNEEAGNSNYQRKGGSGGGHKKFNNSNSYNESYNNNEY